MPNVLAHLFLAALVWAGASPWLPVWLAGPRRAAVALHSRRDTGRAPLAPPPLDHRARHLSLSRQDPRRGRCRRGASRHHADRRDKGRPELRADGGLPRLRGGHRARRGAGQPAGDSGHLPGLRRAGHLLPAGHEAAGPGLPGERRRITGRRSRPRRRAGRRDGRRRLPPGRLPAGPAALLVGNLVGVLAGMFGLGLLLAFTPCVLPMVPILVGHDRPLGPGASRRGGAWRCPEATSSPWRRPMPASASRRRGSAATCRSPSRPLSPSA